MFYYPTSIDRTERCYQFVITSLLSIKDSRDILISVNYTINLYIFVTDLIDNHILFPYRIFIICPKADPFGEIRLHSRKHLKIFKLIINLFYRLRSIFLVVFGNVIPNILQIPPHDGQHPTIQLYTSLLPGRIRVGSSDGAVVSVSIACHLKPCMRFSLTRLSDNLLPAAFKRPPHIFSYLDNKSTLFHWLHTTFEIHTTHALCISSAFACNTPVSIASSTRIHQAV